MQSNQEDSNTKGASTSAIQQSQYSVKLEDEFAQRRKHTKRTDGHWPEAGQRNETRLFPMHHSNSRGKGNKDAGKRKGLSAVSGRLSQ